METNLISEDNLPKNESARIAVERARKIVRENNEMILRLKSASNIESPREKEEIFIDAENFVYEDSHAFELYKIRSNNSVRDFFKGIFGVH